MGWVSPYLNRPISIGDLATALGCSGTDLGSIIKDYGGMANKWAVHKAVKSPAIGVLSRADKKALNFGLVPPDTNSNFVATFGQAWAYDWPTAGRPNEWFRILDYDGYNKSAPPPVAPIGDLTVYVSQGDFNFGAYIEQKTAGGDSDAVAWDDLTAIKDYYLCAIFSTTESFTGGNLLAKTSSTTFANGGTLLVITQAELTQLSSDGYKYYYLVARSVALSGLVIPTTNAANYMALPCDIDSDQVRGKFTIQAAAVASIAIKSVSSVASPTRALQFVDATNYVGLESVPPQDSEYFSVANEPYWLHLGLDITAGSSAFAIGSTARIRLSETFNSDRGFQTPVNCSVRDSDFNSVSQVVIPAGQTQRVYLIASAPILGLYYNGSQGGAVAEHKRFSTRVEVYQNSTLVDRNTDLRVRNY